MAWAHRYASIFYTALFSDMLTRAVLGGGVNITPIPVFAITHEPR